MSNYRMSSIEFDDNCFRCLQAVSYGNNNQLKCRIKNKLVRCDYVCDLFKNIEGLE